MTTHLHVQRPDHVMLQTHASRHNVNGHSLTRSQVNCIHNYMSQTCSFPLLVFFPLTLLTSAGPIYDMSNIAILAKVRYRYLVESQYFDILGIGCPLFETFDISTPSPFDDVNAKAQHHCRRRCLQEQTLQRFAA